MPPTVHKAPCDTVWQSVADLVDLRQVSGDLTNDEFAHALGFQGYYDAAAARAADLRAFGVLERGPGKHTISALGTAVLFDPTTELMIEIATRPEAFRQLWQGVAAGSFDRSDVPTEAWRPFMTSSLAARFVDYKGVWNSENVRAAIAAGFARPTINVTQLKGNLRSVSDQELGLTITFSNGRTSVFPDQVLRRKLLFPAGPVKATKLGINGDVIDIASDLTALDSLNAFNFIRGAYDDQATNTEA